MNKKQSECKTECYANNNIILFRYILSDNEKKILCDISYDVINKCKTSDESKQFVINKKADYESLLSALTEFFTKKPGSYFLRLSTLSPKDAYYYLNKEFIDLDNLDDEETSHEIKNELNILKVSTPIECIQLLLHSYRVLCELDSHYYDENAVILMPWKNIVHDTETRCYVYNRRLIAISQYYTDCIDSYTSIKSIDDFYHKIINFINNYIDEIEKRQNCSIPNNFVIDLAKDYDSDNIMMIELNTYDENTDSCLFSWDEINSISAKECNPIFRYMENKKIVEK
jgi:hypothetical protein